MLDSHAHYDDARFDGDRDALLTALFAEKTVTHIIKQVQLAVKRRGKLPFTFKQPLHADQSGEDIKPNISSLGNAVVFNAVGILHNDVVYALVRAIQEFCQELFAQAQHGLLRRVLLQQI